MFAWDSYSLMAWPTVLKFDVRLGFMGYKPWTVGKSRVSKSALAHVHTPFLFLCNGPVDYFQPWCEMKSSFATIFDKSSLVGCACARA